MTRILTITGFCNVLVFSSVLDLRNEFSFGWNGSVSVVFVPDTLHLLVRQALIVEFANVVTILLCLVPHVLRFLSVPPSDWDPSVGTRFSKSSPAFGRVVPIVLSHPEKNGLTCKGLAIINELSSRTWVSKEATRFLPSDSPWISPVRTSFGYPSSSKPARESFLH